MRYIALLRGVNVGGNNKVSMKDLKSCFEKAGFCNVSTYINSGNVLFDSDEQNAEKLVRSCEDILLNEFGFPISLAVIDGHSLREALDHAPAWWGEDPESKHNAIFVIPPATSDDINTEVGAVKPEYEKVAAWQNVIFWSAPLTTFSRTRWSKVVGTKAYQYITIRNANTAKKLLELVSSFQIIESGDYETLTYLFYENGLEITPGIHKPDEVIKFWECRDPISQQLIGGVALERRSSEFVVADLAVNIEHRNQNIGTQLMEVAEAEIIRLGGTEAWLVGRVPDYYLKLGWEIVAREKAPEISICFSCSRYGKECNPEVMRKSLL